MRRNLKGVKYKGIICNHDNFTKEAKRISKNIPICLIGSQSLPKPFYKWFRERNGKCKRNIDNKKTVSSFLNKVELIPPMYLNNSMCNGSFNIENLAKFLIMFGLQQILTL